MARPLVGLIVPSSNPTIERYIASSGVSARLGVDFVCTRIRVRHIDAGADSSGQFSELEMRTAAELLVDAGVSAVLWAGTSGFWLGGAREQTVLDRVSARIGCPVGSSRQAMLAALAESGAERLAVLTPYIDVIHQAVVADLVAAGYVISAHAGLNMSHNLSFAQIPAEELAAEISKLGVGGDPVVVVCTNMLGLCSGLDPSVFVVDSVLATLWYAARLNGATALSYRSAGGYADV